MTITQKQFRILILAQFLLIIVGGIVFAFDDSLPHELNLWLEKSYSNDPTLLDYAYPVMGFAAFLSMIGMLFFKSWARSSFLIISIVSYSLEYFAGPSVLSGRMAFYMDLLSCLLGFTLAILYFSNVDSFFRERSHKN